MSAAVLKVLKLAKALSPEERKELIDSLQEPYDDLGLDPEFIKEINRRSDEIDAGIIKGRKWSEIRKEYLTESARDN